MRAPFLAVLLTLLLPGIAQADFDVPAFGVTPTSLQAGSHPDVTIHAEFSGSEHVRDLTISLPPGLVGDPRSKPKCAQAAFQADNCPARARVGSAVARTPLLAQPLTGPVALAALPGRPLPGLRMDLSGAAALSLAGAVDFNPIRATFAGIPDVPLERFELTFDPKRTLVTRRNLCRGPVPRIAAELTGHNGATVRLDEPLEVTGCVLPDVTLTVNRRQLKLRVAALRGRPLQRVQLKLPRHVRLRSTSVARADGRRLRRVRGRIVTVSPGATRHFAITGTLNHRLKKRRTFVLETLDSTGRVVRRALARR